MDMRALRAGEDLSRLPPFAGLDSEGLGALARASWVSRYQDGTLILLEGDSEAPVHFVMRGAVRVFRSNLEGREQTLIYLHPGEALNLPGVFAASANVPASAQAVGDVALLSLRAAELRQLAALHPSISLALLRMLATRVHHLSLMVYDLGLLSVRARIARFLLTERSARQDTPVRWTHAQIAARVGTVRVVVSRTLAALADEGYIRLERQRIEVLDAAGLAAMAQVDIQG